jgi:ubiquinone/menaquinone biosynthesis C-methylase UbiE
MKFSTSTYYSNYPKSHPAYNVIRIAGKNIQEKAKNNFSGVLLDIGCGTKAKQHLIGDRVKKYIGLDHHLTTHGLSNLDIIGTAYKIPVIDNSFNCIICTAVLEHLEEPRDAIQEAYRVLKSGGYALYTTPLFWHLHEAPLDYFRYTKFGLQHLFQSAGFDPIEITPLSGFWTTFGTEFSYYLQRFKNKWMHPIIDGLVIMNNFIFPKLDTGILRNESFTWMYLVLAKKPNQ